MWFRLVFMEEAILHRLSANHARRARQLGFTLIELVVVLAILGILLALSVPQYLGARKRAYKEEAGHILQELKALSWAYYQESDTFSGMTAAGLGFQMPAGSRWQTPTAVVAPTTVTWTANGSVFPLLPGDACSVTLNGDGSASQSCTFF